jgi:tyrosine-protein phosphatase non-receptor type 11
MFLGKTKCARYWPEVDKTEDYGHIRVRSVAEVNNKDYILRQFSVSRRSSDASASSEQARQIYHFHFLGWPDHGTPEDPGSVLSFLHDVNLKQEQLERPGPIVVHCSAGIGRTGTFIVIDMIIGITRTKMHKITVTGEEYMLCCEGS